MEQALTLDYQWERPLRWGDQTIGMFPDGVITPEENKQCVTGLETSSGTELRCVTREKDSETTSSCNYQAKVREQAYYEQIGGVS